MLRPTKRLAAFCSLISLKLPVSINLPSRSTVYFSQMANSSGILCEIKIMLNPCAFKLRMISKRISISLLVRADVGSSIIINLESNKSARAISTSCLREGSRFVTVSSGLMSILIFFRISLDRAIIVWRSKNPARLVISCPKKRFS